VWGAPMGFGPAGRPEPDVVELHPSREKLAREGVPGVLEVDAREPGRLEQLRPDPSLKGLVLEVPDHQRGRVQIEAGALPRALRLEQIQRPAQPARERDPALSPALREARRARVGVDRRDRVDVKWCSFTCRDGRPCAGAAVPGSSHPAHGAPRELALTPLVGRKNARLKRLSAGDGDARGDPLPRSRRRHQRRSAPQAGNRAGAVQARRPGCAPQPSTQEQELG